MDTGTKKSGAWKMRFGLFGLIALCLVVLFAAAPPPVQAADFRNGERVVIGANEVINDDLFITATEIVVDGTVKGDLYAFGTNVTVNGTVEHDVIIGGQAVTLNGAVGDTARIGAQAIIFGDKAKIARSALVGGFSLETKPGSVVGGDLLFGAYQALLTGAVQHDVIAGAYGVEITGNVGRNVRVSVGDETNAGPSPMLYMPNMTVSVPSVPAGLTIAPTAKIGGDLVYESYKPVTVPSGATVTGPIVQQMPAPNTGNAPLTPEQIQQQQAQQTTEFFLNEFRRFVVLLLIGLLVLWLLPKWTGVMSDFIETKPLGSLGRGALMFLGYVVAVVLIMIVAVMLAIVFGVLTLGSLSGASLLVGLVVFGVLMVGYYVFISYVAPIVVSYVIGHLLFHRVQATWAQNRFVQFIVGLILLSLVSLIPIVNWFIGVLVAIFALGALYFWIAPRFAHKPTQALAPAA